MKISLETMIQKYNNCIANLDGSKTCHTCKHKEIHPEEKPCADCCNMILGMPVNPTNWKGEGNE